MAKTVQMMHEELDYLYNLLDYLDDNIPCLGELIDQFNEQIEEGENNGHV